MSEAGKHRLEPRSVPSGRDPLPPAGLPEVVGGAAKWEGVQVDRIPPEVSALRILAFYDCDLSGLSLAGNNVSLRLIDCNARRLDLANVRFKSLEVVSSALSESRLVGATLVGSFRDVVVTDCLFDLASLHGCNLSRTEFRSCSLTEVDAAGTELRSVLLSDSNLTGADFSQAKWERSQIRACNLTAFRGIEDLRGVQIPMADLVLMAPLLATTLGMIPID